MKQTLFLLGMVMGVLSQVVAQNDDCVDVYRWQYQDYTNKPLFPNQIFAKGFGIHVLVMSKKKSLDEINIKTKVMQAFQNALMTWCSALRLNYERSPIEIKKFIDQYSFKQNGRSTLNTPLVFQVQCPEDANFVIKIFIKNGKRFIGRKSMLALAQIQGRTIALNFRNFLQFYDQKNFNLKDGDNYNLVPVLAHELGHSFGLEHSPNPGSIMAAVNNQMSKFPTRSDGILFSEALMKKIIGADPGAIIPTACEGLRAY